MMLHIGTTIAIPRQQKGVTQEEMARAIGTTAQAISKWERGKNYPDLEPIPTIADFFGVSIDRLLR